jgi:hypothetical protein
MNHAAAISQPSSTILITRNMLPFALGNGMICP